MDIKVNVACVDTVDRADSLNEWFVMLQQRFWCDFHKKDKTVNRLSWTIRQITVVGALWRLLMLVYKYDLAWLEIHDHYKVIKGLSYKNKFMIYFIINATISILLCYFIVTGMLVLWTNKYFAQWHRKMTSLDREYFKFINRISRQLFSKKFLTRPWIQKPTGGSGWVDLDMCWHFELAPSYRG